MPAFLLLTDQESTNQTEYEPPVFRSVLATSTVFNTENYSADQSQGFTHRLVNGIFQSGMVE